MKNIPKKGISTLAAAIFIMTSPMTEGIGSILAGAGSDRKEIMPSATVSQNPILLAADEKETDVDDPQEAAVSDDQISIPESGLETDSKQSSAKSKPTPLKSFKPSEEIAAEQAVDFPVDI